MAPAMSTQKKNGNSQWILLWKTDRGRDGEDYWLKCASPYLRYGYAAPSHKAVLGCLCGGSYTDAMLACFLKLTENEVESLKFDMREALRVEGPYPAKRDIIIDGKTVCRKGDKTLLWMLNNGNIEFESEMQDLRGYFEQHNIWKRFFRQMSPREKKQELKSDLNERYDVAPYALRMVILDRLISATISNMKSHPHRRTLVEESQGETFRERDKNKIERCPLHTNSHAS